MLLFEDPYNQSEALKVIPVERLSAAALEKAGPGASHHLIRDKLHAELLAWYKSEFFSWVNNPKCEACQSSNTTCLGGTRPNPIEQIGGMAGITEIYKCNDCGYQESRFPRYNNPLTLLHWRKGRCGEFANCFTLLCRAMGFEARHVHDWTDHVWTEVYSEESKRWIHCDACENARDAPLMYESGWGKKLSYVIANSKYECVDVTKRYSKKWDEVCLRRVKAPKPNPNPNPKHTTKADPNPNPKAPEPWLAGTIAHLDREQKAQSGADEARLSLLSRRREAEILEFEKRLDAVVVAVRDVEAIEAENRGRQSGSLLWRSSRGELGEARGSGLCVTPPPVGVENVDVGDGDDVVKPRDGWYGPIRCEHAGSSANMEELSMLGTARGDGDAIMLTESAPDQVGSVWWREALSLEGGLRGPNTNPITLTLTLTLS